MRKLHRSLLIYLHYCSSFFNLPTPFPGQTQSKQRPEVLKQGILARIPPLPVNF
jgi:predicted metal-binding protein